MMSIPVMLAALATAAQAPGDARPWQVVVSKVGQFTVEMPAKPTTNESQTRTTPTGKIREITIACETDKGTYVARKIEFSDEIPKGVEEAVHDAIRQGIAQEFKGTVATEKKVNLLGRVGRDYTVRGQPEKGVVAAVRVRQYLAKNAIYAMIVVSPPNRNLPDDAGKFLGSFAPGLHPEGTTRKAEIGPEPTGRDLPGWGTAIDPGNDCTIRPEGSSLTIGVPGTLHDLNADTGKFNAPRVLREVAGDFTAVVRVDGSFKPSNKALSKTSVPVNAGGLFVWRDAENYIRLERMTMFKNGKLVNVINFEEREGGHRGAVHNRIVPPGTNYIRLQRKGNQISASVSDDGVAYELLRPIETAWPSKLKVGLVAINSCADPMTVKFDGFALKTARANP